MGGSEGSNRGAWSTSLDALILRAALRGGSREDAKKRSALRTVTTRMEESHATTRREIEDKPMIISSPFLRVFA